ncbi:MAG: hypothetical protein ABJQ41_01565 [Marinomonas sp.]
MLVDGGVCRKIRIERLESGVRAGGVVDARFVQQWVAGMSGIVCLETGEEALLQPIPEGLTEGSNVRVEITRASWNEKNGQEKRAKARPAASGTAIAAGPGLLAQIEANGIAVKPVRAHGVDDLTLQGWPEALEEAETGKLDFDGGTLLICVTPAMTVIDIDGPLAPFELAKRAAKQVALLLPRLDITGSVGVDFPTLDTKAKRTEIGKIFDDHMSADCERTAVNGFGFMQIVSRKTGPSVVELLQANQILNAALQMLRQAERSTGTGELCLELHSAVAAKLNAHPQWLEELAKRSGRPVRLEAKGNVPIQGGRIVTG